MVVRTCSLFFISLFIIGATLGTPLASAADLFSSIQNDLSIYPSPRYPKANESVEIFIESYTTNLDQSSMDWRIDGKTDRRGVGIKSIIVPAGNVGSKKTISVTVATKEGRIFEQNVTISISEVEILWEADTYTPPFYKGKALYSPDAPLSLLAIPTVPKGTRPETLTYLWKKDGVC